MGDSSIEVAQLVNSDWVCTASFDGSMALGEVVRRLTDPGCSQRVVYKAVGVAVALVQVPGPPERGFAVGRFEDDSDSSDNTFGDDNAAAQAAGRRTAGGGEVWYEELRGLAQGME